MILPQDLESLHTKPTFLENTMRTLFLGVAAMLIACGSCVTAYGGLISANDDFSTNTTNGGVGDWSGNWTLNSSTISGSSLNITGNSNNAAIRSLSSAINAVDHHTVNMSFDVAFSGTLNSNTFLGFWLGNPTSANPNFGIKSGQSAAGDFFARRSGTSGTYGFGNAAGGAFYRIDARITDTDNNSAWDTMEFRVDGNPWVTVSSGTIGLASFSQIGFRSANMGVGDTFTVGQMSITAVPEPTSLLMVGSAVLGLCTIRRRKLI
jgi:hypothetical protein